MIKGFWAKKIGMTQVFSGNKVVPVTVVDTSSWFVTDVKNQERDGYYAVQVGRVRKRYEGLEFSSEWLKKKKDFFTIIREIRSEVPVENVQVGQLADFESNFSEGAFVDVRGITKGCGFAGVFKKHGFTGGPSSHGDKMGRRTGSLSFMRREGRVIKGKGMPGHMGSVQRAAEGLEIVKIQSDSRVVLVKGSVPGKAGSFVFVCDRVKG